MTGSRQKDAARARLARRHPGKTGAEVIAAVNEAVEDRNPPSDEEANSVASEEIRRMRADKRAKDFITSQRG